MSVMLFPLIAILASFAWAAFCAWACRTPELTERHGRILGALGTLLGLGFGITGAIVGLACTT